MVKIRLGDFKKKGGEKEEILTMGIPLSGFA